jgi:hypothetical protein
LASVRPSAGLIRTRAWLAAGGVAIDRAAEGGGTGVVDR